MLLETVLETLDLESLTGVLHHVYLKSPPHALEAVPEAMALEATLPNELFQMMTHGNRQGASALSFALRHQVCYLNVLFHLESLARRGLAIDFTALTEMFGRDISTDRLLMALMLEERHWAPASVPVFGFSPKSLHVTVRRLGACRAFDVDSFPSCENPAELLFCREHGGEEWWSDCGGSSPQAMAYRFFASLRHFETEDLHVLTRLASHFWASYQVWKRASQGGSVGGALGLFNIPSEKDLLALGTKGLRERFCMMAMTPSLEQSRVLDLKDGYNVLKRRLEYQNVR